MKLFFLCAFFSLSTAFAQGIVAVANISKISGSATINNEAVTVGQEVTSGTLIKLAKKGDYLDIKFQNGHKVRLMGATVKVLDLTPKSTVFELVSGTIYAWANKLTNNERFRVKTKTASFAVRGTKFFLQEDKKETYLCVCDGMVHVEKDNAAIDVEKNFDLFLTKKELGKPRAAKDNMIKMGNDVFNELN
jgi:ferric-dicitrate binding protein FerR (iron transport regulator)